MMLKTTVRAEELLRKAHRCELADAMSRRANMRHKYRSIDGRLHDRAAFTEPEAQRAAAGVFSLTGRRYSAYACPSRRCGAWHIRPCPLRPEDLAMSA